MKRFLCTCGNEVFFDNTYCSQCDAELGFDTEKCELIPLSDAELNRKCEHRTEQLQCNWLTKPDSSDKQCLSCSLTRTIPTLEKPENWRRWYKLEVAKRRLLYGLLTLNLPIDGLHHGTDQGLVFDFLEDQRTNPSVSLQHVYIGHASGVITINAAEADSSFREATREAMNEPYRTLLGHYRHEVGHYFWDKLICNTQYYQSFKELFGDDSLDYRSTMDSYYEAGPDANWQDNYISAYASSHPLEDWAETWAHYLLIIETLETALSFNLITKLDEEQQFDSLMTEWMQLVVVLNALNRSTGSKDAYPFVISDAVKEKLSFIHHVIRQ